jgi:hypothetical protein
MGRVFPAALQWAKEAGLDRAISVTDAFVINRITITFTASLKCSMRLHERAQYSLLKDACDCLDFEQARSAACS